jgi:hypothetical protein
MEIWQKIQRVLYFLTELRTAKSQQAMETAVETEGEQPKEARIETDKGFLYVFKPDHNFWLSAFLLGREEKEAEFNRVLTEAVLRFRQLTERLSKIKLPKEIKE